MIHQSGKLGRFYVTTWFFVGVVILMKLGISQEHKVIVIHIQNPVPINVH